MRVRRERLYTSDFTARSSPAEAQCLQVGEVGEVSQAGDVVVGEVQVDQLGQV